MNWSELLLWKQLRNNVPFLYMWFIKETFWRNLCSCWTSTRSLGKNEKHVCYILNKCVLIKALLPNERNCCWKLYALQLSFFPPKFGQIIFFNLFITYYSNVIIKTLLFLFRSSNIVLCELWVFLVQKKTWTKVFLPIFLYSTSFSILVCLTYLYFSAFNNEKGN